MSNILVNLVDADTNRNHITSVCKDNLIKSCRYFQTMLENFREADSNSVRITIKFAKTAKMIIKSIGGYRYSKLPWYQEIQSYYCYEYFGISYKIDTNLIIPNDKFGEFMDMVDLIGYHDDMIELIANNIKIHHNFYELPHDLLVQIKKVLENKYDLITEDIQKVCIRSGKSMERYFVSEYPNRFIDATNRLHVYVQSLKKLIVAHKYGINIYDNTHDNVFVLRREIIFRLGTAVSLFWWCASFVQQEKETNYC